MIRLEMTVHGLPIAQPRVRACIRGRHAGVYDPGTAKPWKACVILAARRAMAELMMDQPIRGPVEVIADFMMPRPNGHYRTGKNAGELRPKAKKFHDAKPDLENIEKSTLDALTEAGVWADDSLVCIKITRKVYVHPSAAGATIVVKEVVE